MSAARSAALSADALTHTAAKPLFQDAEQTAARAADLARNDGRLRDARVLYVDAERKYASARDAAGSTPRPPVASEADRAKAAEAKSAAEARRGEAVAAQAPALARDTFAAAQDLERRAASAFANGAMTEATKLYRDAESRYADAARLAAEARQATPAEPPPGTAPAGTPPTGGDVEAAARQELAAMLEAKRKADAVDAKSIAPEVYAVAENLESLAGASLSVRDVEKARQQYADARNHYDKAADTAKARAADPAFVAMLAAQRAMEQSKEKAGRLPAGKKPNPQYMAWAAHQEQKGQTELRNGQYKRAEKAFSDAKLFYDKAISTAR